MVVPKNNNNNTQRLVANNLITITILQYLNTSSFLPQDTKVTSTRKYQRLSKTEKWWLIRYYAAPN